MELMKELGLNLSSANQTYMLLLMSGAAPTTAAQLLAAVNTKDFCDMWSKSIGVAYVTGARGAYNGTGNEWTTFFNAVTTIGQMKGGQLRVALSGHTFGSTPSANCIVPETIELQDATGNKIECGWFSLFVAQMLCRLPNSGSVVASYSDAAWLSPHQVPEMNPTAHIVIGFGSEKTLTGMSIDQWASASTKVVAVDYWDGAAWVQCVAQRATSAAFVAFTATTTKVRLRLGPGNLPLNSEASCSFAFYSATPEAQRQHPAVTWGLLIPTGSRPLSQGAASVQALVTDGVITRKTRVPFYAFSIGGPGGSEEVLLSKATGLTSDDLPTVTGFYLRPQNMKEV